MKPALETTNTAEGLLRRRWTVAELEAMTRAGILAEDERLELIGGEVVPMSPKGNRHEVVKAALTDFLVRELPDTARIVNETTFRLDENTYLEPDILVYSMASGLAGLTARNALLVIEIADTSLRYDMGRKAQLWAAFGLSELWVVDAETLVTRVHRQPTPAGCACVADVEPNAPFASLALPQLSITLGGLRYA